ncbi:multidrug efflux pump subunit AcrB [Paraburkholderia youngii]
MNIPALFIRRPVATTLLAIAILISGTLAYFRMPVAPLPNIAFPVIVVQANMAGASPNIMASTVAEPLERRLATIADVEELTSISYVGSSMIIVEFGLKRDINGAARDVEAAIQAARADLPTTLRSNPSYRQYNPADAPIVVLSLTSDTLTKAQLYDSADSVIQQQLSQVQGVGQITLGGGALPSVRVELQPGKLNSYGIGMEDVRAAISAANADSAKGHIDVGDQRYVVTSNDQITHAAPYRDLVVAYRDGAPVKLRDVAQVRDSNENIRNAGLFNGKSAILGDRLSDAGQQRGQHRAADPQRAAGDRSDVAEQRARGCRDRSLAVGHVVSRRYRAHAVHRGAAGGRRRVHLPAVAARDADSGGRVAAVDRRHLRADVSARL